MKHLLLLLFVELLAYSVQGRNVVIQNNKLFVDGTEFFIKGVDYNPTPLGEASMGGDGYGGGGFCSSKMTPYGEWKSACYDSDYFDGGADYYTRWPPAPADGFAALWRRDFPLIKSMGANTLRLYNANPTTRQMSQIYPTSKIPFPQGKDHIPFLDLAQQYGFSVVFPLYSDMGAFNTLSEEDFKRFLRAQIDEVGNHSAVLIWQFGNEMNWDGDLSVLGFYPYPDLMNKYNNYAQYIRQYTLAKWGRKIPITHAVIDFDTTFDWLMEYFDIDIFSLNTFRGTSTTTLFPGDGNTKGFTYDTCAWNKPLLITEFGWSSYTSGWANQLISDFVSHIDQGLIGIILFEHNDEPVPQYNKYWGAFSVAVSYNGSQSSTDENAFLVDTLAPKPLFTDVSQGQYNNIAYNYHSDFYALAGRSAQSLGSSADTCANVGTFYNCPGGYPSCSGHGICNGMSGACTCASGWAGSDCSTPVCQGSPPCSGHGSCSILTSPPQCACATGYYGVNCEIALPSTPTSCPNNCTGNFYNGICQNNVCQCVSGWTGHDCSIVSIQNPFPGIGTPTSSPTQAPTSAPASRPICVGPIGENQVLSLTCPNGETISSVQFASYGTPTGSCGSFAKSSCDASTSVSVFDSNCLNKNTCSFTVGNGVFGDPCTGIVKHFYAQVTCTATPSIVSPICAGPVSENQVISLTCPQKAQKITSVQFASYGTPTGTCRSLKKGTCDASTSTSVFSSNCLNRNSCSFTVGNDAFGDPCYGTAKQFAVEATCSS
eukprot:Phypoly_transcript_03482.p1 GENE.Phypoly_transcript_03482~~Phypoly_transcript_03482.p1  ORF type:complete len:768 (+),score=86.79 Phypoly_transcript_03482:78-2381(+)